MIQFHVDKYQTGTPLIYLHKNHILEFNKKNGKQKFIEFNVNKSMKHSVLSTPFVHVVYENVQTIINKTHSIH